MRVNRPAVGFAGHPLGVDGHHDGLRTVGVGHFFDEDRARHGGAVDRHLVGPGVQKLTHVAPLANSAAHGQGNRDGRGGAVDEVEQRSSVLVRRRDIEEGDLIRATGAVALGGLDRVTCITQAHEVDPLHDAPFLDVETGDDSLGQHQASSSALNACDKVKAPE